MRVLSRQRDRSRGEDNPYVISFSDLMGALLLIFILAIAVMMLSLAEMKRGYQERIEIAGEGEELRRSFLQELKVELERLDILVEITDEDSVLRIPDKLISFRSGSYDKLVETGDRDPLEELETIGARLNEMLALPKFVRLRNLHLDTIFIEGHTDSDPFPGFIHDNWGLSTHRAIFVWEQWSKNERYGHQLASLTNKDGRYLFSVSGYGSSRRANEDEASDLDKQRNRRIDLRFTLRTLTRSELERFEQEATSVTTEDQL